MFDDFDDNDAGSEDFFSQTDIEETLKKFNLLNSDQSIFFSEEEIEALSYHFFLNNQHKDQMTIINHGLYLYPNKVDFLIEKASILCMSSIYDEALKLILVAKSLEPYNAVIHKMEGEIMCDLDRPIEAEESFILALEFAEFEDDEFVIDVYNSYGQLLSQNEEVSKANKIIEKGLKHFPENEILFNQLALNFISNSLFDQATLYFKKIIDTNPYSHLAWYQLGRIYEMTDLKDLALEAYEYSSLANKDSKNAFFNLAGLYENKSEYNKAIENYQQCIKNNGDVYPFICVARCYLGIDEPILARNYLKKAQGLEDILPEYNYLLGYSYLTEKQARKALPYFEKVYKEDKSDFAALKGILTCFSDLEKLNEIESIYNALKFENKELIHENWKELASVLYISEMDALLEDLIFEIQTISEYRDDLNCVLNVIKYDQNPSNKNKEVIMSRLIHNFEDTLESVKLFCHTLIDEDEEFKNMIQIYQST